MIYGPNFGTLIFIGKNVGTLKNRLFWKPIKCLEFMACLPSTPGNIAWNFDMFSPADSTSEEYT